MYIPKNLAMELEQSIALIKQYGFAVITSSDLQASHLPLIIERLDPATNDSTHQQTAEYVLYGHMAKANPHWKAMQSQSVLVVFSAPHGYISPTWYDSFPAVPTWNYAVVHVNGTFELTEDAVTLDKLNQTISKYEPSILKDGGFIPAEYRDKLSKAIVGFKISITSIAGKSKLGQHRSELDQAGVLAGLAKSGNLESQLLYQYTKKILS
ncbi:FMN-binding negative transcriptional regulator [Shewanella donghaensis]|uniref:FMN-binding negative transcriptional regulator n=1 Tax=Shewanella donghaensis TaxID=238836 RepID=UPI00118350F4|nr:FMN-binding negative transcriptional regulator [Shewanella donghaensis]